ncbi:pimeloyl-ACP methyl ester carboxylesterase [Luteibacter sp. Sphag1AF]|uniref:alpha/beta fold hydrolase n=1 Tax=Luteibacter sp. Sphag1AF TaxID=2587031 RepID=UPI0018040C01|nr:alpha/beta hydrolase [Luteibacter sp. Sphag1AF]MBB3227525.1 pimeloyl-ACP methyl ester carboxylesterase [Luteibacter sp. Sphag1AF]
MNRPKLKLIGNDHGMAYVDAGSGPAVVFIHGSLCDYRYWTPQLDALADGWSILAPSLSHYFPRLPSADRFPFRWSQHADDVVSFCRKLRHERVHLVGHSRGASVAFQAVLRDPAAFASVTLLDPGGAVEGEGSDEGSTSATQRVRCEARDLIARGEVDAGLSLFVNSVSGPAQWERSPEWFRRMARDNAHTLGPQLDDPLPMMMQADAQALSCPVLLVDGEKSPSVYRRNVATLAQWLPCAQHATIAGASHGMSMTHAGAFNAVLRSFLSH